MESEKRESYREKERDREKKKKEKEERMGEGERKRRRLTQKEEVHDPSEESIHDC